jgi:PST family polysaccharide transporter
MNDAVTSVTRVLASAAMPPVLFLAGSAVPLVAIVYGNSWLPAASALSWLAVAALCKIFCDLYYDYLIVLGKSGTVLLVQAGSLVVLIPALAAGAYWLGVAGIAAAQATVAAFVVLPLYLWQLRKSGIGVRVLIGKMLVPLAAAAITWLIAWAAAAMIPDRFLAVIAAGTAALAISAALLLTQADQIRQLRTIGRGAPTGVPA